MNKMMIGAAMGMVAGVALMMSPMGKAMRKEVNMGKQMVKRMANKKENM